MQQDLRNTGRRHHPRFNIFSQLALRIPEPPNQDKPSAYCTISQCSFLSGVRTLFDFDPLDPQKPKDHA